MTSAESPPLRWWGWGDRAVDVPAGLLALLRDELDVAGDITAPPPRLEDVRLPDPQLAERLRRRLVGAVGAVNVKRDRAERIRHATGRSYLDLLALRSGRLDAAPDAVVYASTAAQLTRLLRVCSDAGCAVVPFGGGTSVVGGVAPLPGSFSSVITLNLERFNAVERIDGYSLLATLQAGVHGPDAEGTLRAHGVMLGHYPQSFEYASIGGFAAARSAGQASSGTGRFDELVRGLTLVAPSGVVKIPALPPASTGPSLLQLALGSEGTMGAITDVTVRVRALPRWRHYAGWSFPDLPAGVEAMREMAQAHALPDVTRLSDEEETRVSLAMASHNAATRMARHYLRARGQRTPCLAIMGWEGEAADVGAAARRTAAVLGRHGAVSLGAAPGKAWLRSRFEGPYLRDALLDRGVLAETLETAAPWSQLLQVRAAAAGALRAALGEVGTPPLVGCHVSHVYPDGASLYFTVIARQSSSPVEQWRAAKGAATQAILARGGALSHHHGVGRDHATWMPSLLQATGAAALRALRHELDPAGIMNPGVLLPSED